MAKKPSAEITSFVPTEQVARKIYLIRGLKVMLDSDLAGECSGGEATHGDDTNPGAKHQATLNVPARPELSAPYIAAVSHERDSGDGALPGK